MTGCQVQVDDADAKRRERMENEAGQRKGSHFEAPNSSTLANVSADHGRKRFSVNFVF
jgi:hypothetical protein